MTTVHHIAKAVSSLSPEELVAFRAWFADFDAEAWDRQLAEEAAVGRLDPLAKEALDPYWKLRPPGPTPPEEVCHCSHLSRIVLCGNLGDNPLRCLECNGEVPPERVGFSAALAEEIAFWRSVHDALQHLWLDSGEYEQWAMERLTDPSGSVNRRGLEIVRELTHYVPAYYWWFQDIETGECTVGVATCPNCGDTLSQAGHYLVCEMCRILVPCEA